MGHFIESSQYRPTLPSGAPPMGNDEKEIKKKK